MLVNVSVMFVVGWSLVFLHELAHAVIARARGCVGSLSLSRRLYFLVAQTDMSGIRAIPRSQRYAPYLAGMTFHLAVMLGCAWLQLAGAGGRLPRVVAFLATVQLVFEFAVFLRTDVYYVLTNWLRLGNLNQDARGVLMNLWQRLLGRPPAVDLSSIPERERRIVNRYVPVYVIGVLIALADLMFLVAPVLADLTGAAIDALVGASNTMSRLDGGAFLALTAFNMGAPLVILIRELHARRKARNTSQRVRRRETVA